MAENSSSSTCEGSSSRNQKFEVFISHRGPETKRTLAYHMYDLLRDRGVEVFLDKEELQSGESFPLAIEEAIACSKVNVCILSKGFAESVWCLKELQMMLDKYEMGKSKLIPIFYDVEPCDVRHLQGAFGQGFQKIIDNNRYSTQLIDKWRHALYKIGEVKGDEGKGECCMAVVNKILDELDVGLLVVPGNLVGRQKELLSIKHDIMRCHQNGCGVTSVEISGVGGIGKTTFAKQLYNQICPQYKRCCFIEDVGGLVEKYGVKEVHNQLISKLLRYEPRNMRMEGKKLLMDRLHNEEILVVLDNIHCKIPLSAVFIEDDVCLNPRSIVIVTSREKAILKNDPRVSRYCQNLIPLELSCLGLHASEELFCQYAFGGIGNVRNEFNELIKKFVTKCQGIPLALTLLGSQVYGREIKFWETLWNSIKDYLHPDLQRILKISYDHLDSGMEKCLFLDVATFLRWEKEDLLVKLHQRDDKDCKSEVLYALDVLKRKNLIEAVNGVLMMHDLLVDLGRSIVRDEDSCPGHRSRVWDPSDVREMLSDDEMGTEKVKALSLVSKGLAVLDEDGCPWPADAFRKLSSLEFLILQGHCIEGDLSKLSKRLLWLKWTDFPYECIPPALCLKRVKILHVSSENLTRLWEHHPEKEAPTKIKQLSVSNCMNLQRLPEFTGKFRHFSCIDLSRCTSLETIPDSFGQLKALKRFQLAGCKSLVLLPEAFGDLTSLCELDMSYCLKIKSLPESFGGLSQLKRLSLNGCKALKHLPGTFEGLTSLSYLEMCYCFKIKSLPESFGESSQLKELWLNQCKALKCLPESLGHMLQLKELGLSGCIALEHLPESFGKLSGLKELDFSNCQALERLPGSFGHLLQLKNLKLIECLALEHLPESFGHLPQLEELSVWKCPILKHLPESFGHLPQLEQLSILKCPALKCFPESFVHLPQLKILTIHCSDHLLENPLESRFIANGAYRLPLIQYCCIAAAEQQQIDCCKNSKGHGQATQQQSLTSLAHEVTQGTQIKRQNRGPANLLSCNNQQAPPQLSDVELTSNHFVQLLESTSALPQEIEHLSFEGLWDLDQLPQSMSNLAHPKALRLRDCVNLQWLPNIHRLSNLIQLEIDHCLNLKELPSSIGNLPHLKTLKLQSCWNLEELLDSIGTLQNLRDLWIDDCIVLKEISYWLGNVSSLTNLSVNSCWMLEVIHLQGLLNLQKLQVVCCLKLRSIVGLSGCPNIREIMIQRNPKLTHMPGIHGCDTSLTSLGMLGCYQLCLPYEEGFVERLPTKGDCLALSFNHDSLMASLDKERLSNELFCLSLLLNHDSFMTSLDQETQLHTLWNNSERSSHVKASWFPHLHAKTCPLLVAAVEQRVRDLLISTKVGSIYAFQKLSDDERFHVHELWHNTSYPFPEMECRTTAVLCFVSGVYAVDFPMHIPLPEITFALRCNQSNGWHQYINFCFDFGDVIHMVAAKNIRRSNIRNYALDVIKREAHCPNYEALVKEGWLIFLDDRGGLHNEILVTEICNIFYSEFMKQRWLSRAWTELPSQLRIFEFSALDLAGCQITKIYRHYNTYIMEEESGLTWNRRRCLFADDHALLLEHSTGRSSKHTFLAYPGLHLGLHPDLEAGAVANLYEMSIFMSIKGKLIHSRKLQEIVSINQQQIPPALKTLLQTNASSSTLATLHRHRVMDPKSSSRYYW